MVDETTTDVSNIEEMDFCLHYVNDQLDVHKEVIGLHSLEPISADKIQSAIKDILLQLNLIIENCCRQCYDGTSNMAGCKSGYLHNYLP